jgi:hypothetical protein
MSATLAIAYPNAPLNYRKRGIGSPRPSAKTPARRTLRAGGKIVQTECARPRASHARPHPKAASRSEGADPAPLGGAWGEGRGPAHGALAVRRAGPVLTDGSGFRLAVVVTLLRDEHLLDDEA